MATNYAPKLPRDSTGEPMQEYPSAKTANVTHASDNNATSSLITLNDNTTAVEIAAVGAGAVVKWIATTNTNPSVISAAGTANFDHVIAPNTVRRFVVPIETIGVSSIVGANKQNGLYNRMAVKSVGAASVLSTEY